ncbi:MAG: tetratricopeptide repeat protein, partial [Anaerolineales bacterium]|nr:tetratricopeptide repeat protein [Anaerolineales bacterium]
LTRNALILLSILLAVFVPFVSSGYAELERAATAPSHLAAAGHYQAAARRLPWRADLYELAGHYFYHAEAYTQAEAAYQKALDRNSLSPDGWVALGDVVYMGGDTRRAAQLWEQGLTQPNPSEKLYSRLAEMYQQNGEYSTAARYLQLYVEKYAEDAPAHYRLGLLLTLSDPNRALSELLSASQLDPQFDPAAQTLRTALNLSALAGTPSEQKVLIGRGLGLVEEWKLAQAAFEDAVKLDEENAEAWAWLGEADQQTAGDARVEQSRNDALNHLDRALDLDPNSPVVRGLRGLYFQRTGNHRQALAEFQSAAKLEPQNPAWYVSIGEEFANLGDLILALEAYQYATTIAPDDASYWRLLADFCARNGARIRDVGLPAAQKAVRLTPKDPLALDTLGWVLVLDGRYYEAERFLSQALEADPGLASAHFHLALLYLQIDDNDSMYEHLVQARDLGSAEAEALLKQYFP